MGMFFQYLIPNWSLGWGRFKVRLNPGPFSVKEHTLIVVIAGSGLQMAYGMIVIITKRLFYDKQDLDWAPAMLLLLSSQCIGFGLAGIAQQVLVYDAKMWWPENLVSSNLLLTFHRLKGKQLTYSRLKVFFALFGAAFVYQFLPSYFMPLLQSVSVVCLIANGGKAWDKSKVGSGPPSMPQMPFLGQIGSGLGGGGVGAVTLDWSAISVLSPLYTPFWAQVNTLAGNYLFAWLVIPLFVVYNVWDAQLFPAYSTLSYQTNGTRWNPLLVIDPETILSWSDL